ncbi:hypothetical protein ACFOLF_20985 [Paenibacillus sepulcri]|uniref:Uncharacterized protein n=1 Tax=Paenibacillus sepulcri TaxID=359917 RepID=A0ABS7BW71_9BACL|nr:hypothetical protein [Paenibacillus sepulcri]
MINIFSAEYLMFQNQLEIEKEAKQAWKWMNGKEKDLQPVVPGSVPLENMTRRSPHG